MTPTGAFGFDNEDLLKEVVRARKQEPFLSCSELHPGVCRSRDAEYMERLSSMFEFFWVWISKRWTSDLLEGSMLLRFASTFHNTALVTERFGFVGRRLGNPRQLVFAMCCVVAGAPGTPSEITLEVRDGIWCSQGVGPN